MELDYLRYVSIQNDLVTWFNTILPDIKGFPVNYVYTDRLPSGANDSMGIMFPPSADLYMRDFKGDFIKLSFMLQFKTLTRSSEDRLQAIKTLQYMLDVIQSLQIKLPSDKIVLGLKGISTPTLQVYNESEETSVYSALFELDYKQLGR